MFFVGNRIAIALKEQTLFFSPYDMMLKQVVPYTIIQKVCFQVKDVEEEYF